MQCTNTNCAHNKPAQYFGQTCDHGVCPPCLSTIEDQIVFDGKAFICKYPNCAVPIQKFNIRPITQQGDSLLMTRAAIVDRRGKRTARKEKKQSKKLKTVSIRIQTKDPPVQPQIQNQILPELPQILPELPQMLPQNEPEFQAEVEPEVEVVVPNVPPIETTDSWTQTMNPMMMEIEVQFGPSMYDSQAQTVIPCLVETEAQTFVPIMEMAVQFGPSLKEQEEEKARERQAWRMEVEKECAVWRPYHFYSAPFPTILIMKEHEDDLTRMKMQVSYLFSYMSVGNRLFYFEQILSQRKAIGPRVAQALTKWARDQSPTPHTVTFLYGSSNSGKTTTFWSIVDEIIELALISMNPSNLSEQSQPQSQSQLQSKSKFRSQSHSQLQSKSKPKSQSLSESKFSVKITAIEGKKEGLATFCQDMEITKLSQMKDFKKHVAKNRSVSDNNVNSLSSRTPILLDIHVNNSDGLQKICLVDLPGRQLADNNVKETAYINSLLTENNSLLRSHKANKLFKPQDKFLRYISTNMLTNFGEQPPRRVVSIAQIVPDQSKKRFELKTIDLMKNLI